MVYEISNLERALLLEISSNHRYRDLPLTRWRKRYLKSSLKELVKKYENSPRHRLAQQYEEIYQHWIGLSFLPPSTIRDLYTKFAERHLGETITVMPKVQFTIKPTPTPDPDPNPTSITTTTTTRPKSKVLDWTNLDNEEYEDEDEYEDDLEMEFD